MDRLCAYNKGIDLAILFIPKNLTTSLRHTLPKDWETLVNIFDVMPKRICAILRDPLDRFLSAINMHLTVQDKKIRGFPKIKNENGLYEITTADEHFVPQYKFLEQLPKDSHIDYFYMNENVLKEIESFYNLKFLTYEHFYSSTKVLPTADLKIIKDIYKLDYDLIRNTKFVNKPEEVNG